MGFFFFNNMTAKKLGKFEQIHLNHEIFEKTRSINAIDFNGSQ